MTRALAATAALAVAAAAFAQAPVNRADPAKVLRVAIPIAETGFDPQASQDL